MEKGQFELPQNVTVYSLGKEIKKSRLSYLINFYRYLGIIYGSYDAVFVHMNQEYVLLAGFYWMIKKIPVYLWRNHRRGGILTTIAVYLSTKVFCTSKDSFTARFKKTRIMPVGVDTELFKPVDGVIRKKYSVCMIGRISPVKQIGLGLEAVRILVEEGVQISLSVIGPKTNEEYFRYLKNYVEVNNLSNFVSFSAELPPEKLPEIYSSYEICLNLTQSGSFDKTIVEAAACGAIPLVSNQSLKDLLPKKCVTSSRSEEIAKSLEKLLNAHEQLELQKDLRLFVERESLFILAQKLFFRTCPILISRLYFSHMKKGQKKELILVTGGAGFIGSNFIRLILSKYKNIDIVNLDALTYSGNLENLGDISKDSRYVFVNGNVADKSTIEKVFAKYKPTYVINFAAETHVDRSIHVGAKEFIDTNITGVFNILEEVKKWGVKKCLQVSTDEVFGSLPLDSKKAFKETTPFSPNVPYSATKAAGDLLCNAYFSTWKVPVVVTHCSNNYGPYQYPEKLIPFFILRTLENKTLPLYGDGKNVRDWIFVLDHCLALELCLFKGRPGEVYNIGADNEINNLEIARMILKYFKKDMSSIEFVADRPGHDRRYAINSSKINKELGWKPKYKFEKAFADTIKWYVNNPQWILNVRKKTGIFNPHIDLWKAHGNRILK